MAPNTAGYHTDSLHQPRHPEAPAVLSDTTEGTNILHNVKNSVSENARSCLNFIMVGGKILGFLVVTPYGLVEPYNLSEERQCIQGTVNTKIFRFLQPWVFTLWYSGF